jgi:hypothetical protein
LDAWHKGKRQVILIKGENNTTFLGKMEHIKSHLPPIYVELRASSMQSTVMAFCWQNFGSYGMNQYADKTLVAMVWISTLQGITKVAFLSTNLLYRWTLRGTQQITLQAIFGA